MRTIEIKTMTTDIGGMSIIFFVKLISTDYFRYILTRVICIKVKKELNGN
jgi:hypothetical protein